MPNINTFGKKPSNTSYGADTTNIGYNNAGSAGPWDNSPQNSNRNFNFGGPSSFAPPPAAGAGFSLNDFIKKQTNSNDAARAKNEQNWQGASSYIKQFANPLSPDVIQQMQSENAVKTQGAQNNAFAEQQGILAAGGQDDASSLAAASSQAHRAGMGAQIAANTDIGLKAHQINNQAGLTVGNSILGNLPQYMPDDYSGFGALALAGQNQNFQQGLIQNSLDRPTSPGMTQGHDPVGGRYGSGMSGSNSPGAGFNFRMPAAAPTSRLNSAGGMQLDGQWQGPSDEEQQQRRLMGG